MKVLLVDDEPDILELISLSLHQLENHYVTTAASGAKALEIIETSGERFEAFLLDIQMPGITGIELCQKIREIPQYRYTPIIMTTAMSDKAHVNKAFVAGATDYLTKPFDFLELKHRIALAEKAAFQVAELERSFAEARPYEQTAQSDKIHDLSDPLPIDDVDGVIRVHAFESYLKQMGRMSFHRTALLIVTVTNIADIYERCGGREFCDQITDISEAISDAFCGLGSPFIAYFGSGVFGIAVAREAAAETGALLRAIDDALYRLGLVYRNGEPVEVDISLREIVKPALFFGKDPVSFIDQMMRQLSNPDPASDLRLRETERSLS